MLIPARRFNFLVKCWEYVCWFLTTLGTIIHTGEGRFGKVFKGKAHGIVPDLPNLCTVAIKTATSMGMCAQVSRGKKKCLNALSPFLLCRPAAFMYSTALVGA